MARLPIAGQDSGVWGTILNEFLTQSHNTDGTLKADAVVAGSIADNSVTTATIADSAITTPKLGTSSTPTSGQVLSYNGTALTWSTPSSSGTVPDADATTKGLVQLAGDLTGTAASPAVASGAITSAKLATNAVTTVKITDANVTTAKLADGAVTGAKIANTTITDAQISASAAISKSKLASLAIVDADISSSANIAQSKISGLATSLSGKQALDADLTAIAALSPANDDLIQRKSGAWTNRTPAQVKVDLALTRTDVGLGSVDNTPDANKPISTAVQVALGEKVSLSGNETIDGVKTFTNSPIVPTPGTSTAVANKAYVDATVSSGAPDATTSSKGVIQLAGDLTGTAASPTVAASAITSGKIADGSVGSAELATGSVTMPKLATSASPNSGQLLGYSGTALVWIDSGSVGSYPPPGGIPRTDLDQDVQDALEIGESALQLPSLGLDSGYFSQDVNDALDLAESALQIAPVTSVNGQTGDVVVSSGGSIGDATTSTKGIILLAGALGGTASVPTLSANSVGTTQIADTAVTLGKLATSVQTSLGKADTAVQPGNVVTSVNGQVGAVTIALDNDPVGDATTTQKGILQLAGDLGGTAAAPTVPSLANKVDTTDSRLSDARTPLSHAHAAADITSGVIAPARLGSGSPSSTTYLRGDGTWQIPPTGGSDNGLVQTDTKTAGYTLGSADAGKVIEVNASTGSTITVPSGLTDGMVVELAQMGSGVVTVAAGSGVTLRTPSSLTTRAQYSTIGLRKRVATAQSFPTSNMLWRLKADSISAADGTSITSWADTSGNSVASVTQGTSGRFPTLSTNAVNGHQAVKFDGTNDFLTIPTGSVTALDLARNRSVLNVFIVASYDAVTGTSGTRSLLSLTKGNSSLPSQSRLFMQKNSSNAFQAGGRKLDTDTSSQSVNGGTVTGSQWFVFTARFIYDSSELEIFKNGTSLATKSDFFTDGTSEDTRSQLGAIGSNADGSGEFWDGRIAEILAYNDDLSGAERAAVHTYVQNTYAINVGTDYQGISDEWVVSGDLT